MKNTTKDEPLFSKESLMNSSRFFDYRDLLDALLDSSKEYTVDQVEKMVSHYLKGKVK